MELTLSEVKPIIKYIIENNKTLQEKGHHPVSINICGAAGLGKTSIMEQIASELDMPFVKINLAQISDPAELCGWPIKEHYICKPDGDCKWVTAEVIDAYAKAGWEITDETRMSYAIPAWLKNAGDDRGILLVLDDFSRCTNQVAQSVMEITCRQEYLSWKLPFGSTVLLTTNPDNGDYQVTSFDEAQKTRFISFDVKWDVDSWAKWAEENELDSRAINFLLSYSYELMDRSVAKEAKVNARNYTMFSNIISGIDDWSKPANLATILQIASGCFLDDDDIVGGLFTTFIGNKLDKLLTPEELITKDWKYVKHELEKCLYDGKNYRADIGSIITTRFINYSLHYFSKRGSKTDLVINRILDLIDNDQVLLTEDLIYNLARTLNDKYPAKCNKLLLNPKILAKLV